jgi:ubiquinone/menaquinone biosynthesis C-methylase UbiE
LAGGTALHPKEVNFDQERLWWDGKVSKEEADFADERINRLLRWRIIERHLKGVETILEVGGGTGVFSIPLAKKGYRVVHVDFSAKMIAAAREKGSGTANLQFQLANASDLHMFDDRSFDLVLNMDGAISFCGSAAEKAIAECCRITKMTTIISVSNRAWMIPVWLAESIQVTGGIMPAVYEMFHYGFWHKEQFAENARLIQDYFPTLRAFLPNELKALLEANEMKSIEIRPLGTLANLSEKVLEQIYSNDELLKLFLGLCDEYDTDIDPNGPGTRQRAGLLAVAYRTLTA